MTKTQSVLVKICGTTSAHDAELTALAGADYLGIIVEHPPSPRCVSLDDAICIRDAVDTPVVAVTVNLPLERLLHIHDVLRPYALQLHGDESPALVRELKARGVTVWAVVAGDASIVRQRAAELWEAGADAILVDARITSASGTIYGGTGHTSDWQVARELVESDMRVVLAGGLNPENVADAIQTVQPWIVDVISGVEANKGVKDAHKVEQFILAAQNKSRGNW